MLSWAGGALADAGVSSSESGCSGGGALHCWCAGRCDCVGIGCRLWHEPRVDVARCAGGPLGMALINGAGDAVVSDVSVDRPNDGADVGVELDAVAIVIGVAILGVAKCVLVLRGEGNRPRGGVGDRPRLVTAFSQRCLVPRDSSGQDAAIGAPVSRSRSSCRRARNGSQKTEDTRCPITGATTLPSKIIRMLGVQVWCQGDCHS